MDQTLAHLAKHKAKEGVTQEIGEELNTIPETLKKPKVRNKETVKKDLIHALDSINIVKKFYNLVKEMKRLDKEHQRLNEEFYKTAKEIEILMPAFRVPR